jgi:hypothetical protein
MMTDQASHPVFSRVVSAGLLVMLSMSGCATAVEEPEPTEAETAAVPAEPDTEDDAPRGLRVATPEAAPGYVFFNPLLSYTTYLVDVDGKVVHAWESEYESGGGAYLLDNGHLLRGGQEPDPPVFSGGGQAGHIQELTWDGEVVWDFLFADDDHLLHHDMAVLPNGNILAIAWEAKTAEKAVEAGRRPELTPEAGLWPDMIVEFEPQPPDGARVVWEWHMWDHTIQDADRARANYGDPAEHPERIDINGDQDAPQISAEELARLQALGYVPEDTAPEDLESDFMHTNAIAYNSALDQIAVSVLHYNEIWIIDHSTTTTEAAGREGGRWGRGGDLLYRWGNPRTYGRGGEDDQRLFGQHDVRWVSEGMPGSGRLTLFNNRIPSPDGDHSAVFELVPPTNGDGSYVAPDSDPYGPQQPAWTYVAPDRASFHSFFISGAHRLANGHTFVTEGATGRFFEVTREGDIVWEYATPYSGPVTGSPVAGLAPYGVFRATKVSPGHPALTGRPLRPVEPQPAPVLPPERPPEPPPEEAG